MSIHQRRANKFERELRMTLRSNLRDLEVVVEDRRRDVVAAVEEFQFAVLRRNMVADELSSLCETAA